MVEERPGSWGCWGSWTEEAGAMKAKRDRWGHQRGGKSPLKGNRGLLGADAGS